MSKPVIPANFVCEFLISSYKIQRPAEALSEGEPATTLSQIKTLTIGDLIFYYLFSNNRIKLTARGGRLISKFTLQIVGGGFYLLNKIFLNVMERKRKNNEEAFWFWRKWAWIVYLIGLPPILVIFFRERNWIFGSIELGGAPAMLCGVVAAISRRDAPKWLDRIALLAIPLGLGWSLYDFGGINTLNQLLEIGGSAGFLVGTYLLAKDRSSGYWWFTLMNVATAWLFYIQGYELFVPQQILSVIVTLDSYRVRKKSL